MSLKYRKKQVEVEAIQWNGSNKLEVLEFLDGDNGEFKGTGLFITTLEGCMRASVQDYIIKGVAGEFYPCKPEIFDATYEKC
jgi:hypothetical protein